MGTLQDAGLTGARGPLLQGPSLRHVLLGVPRMWRRLEGLCSEAKSWSMGLRDPLPAAGSSGARWGRPAKGIVGVPWLGVPTFAHLTTQTWGRTLSLSLPSCQSHDSHSCSGEANFPPCSDLHLWLEKFHPETRVGLARRSHSFSCSPGSDPDQVPRPTCSPGRCRQGALSSTPGLRGPGGSCQHGWGGSGRSSSPADLPATGKRVSASPATSDLTRR